MSRLRELVRLFGAPVVFAVAVACGPIALFLTACTQQEKAVVRTVVDIAKAMCTEADTLDACVDKILASKRVAEARAAARRP